MLINPWFSNGANYLISKTKVRHQRNNFKFYGWKPSYAVARVLLVRMWILKDTIIPNAVVEITTTNPNFHLTRFCIVVLIHITRHHKKFYTNLENKNCLPHIEPYELEAIMDIQEAKNSQFLEFLSKLYTLAGENTTLLHEAYHLH